MGIEQTDHRGEPAPGASDHQGSGQIAIGWLWVLRRRWRFNGLRPHEDFPAFLLTELNEEPA